jgi:hypothetical protein
MTDDGAVAFAGDCENGTSAVRFTADLILDTAWGTPEAPGVFWGAENGHGSAFGIDGETVLYMTGPFDDRMLLGRSPDGALVGTLPIDRAEVNGLGPVAVFPDGRGGYLIPGVVRDSDEIGVLAGNLGGSVALVSVISLGRDSSVVDAVVGRGGNLIVAYITWNGESPDRLHLLEIDRNGRQGRAVTDPNLAIRLEQCCWAWGAIAELRNGEIVTAVGDGRGHTQIDKFTASGNHLSQMVGPEQFPSNFRSIDLGVSSIDGDLLVSGAVTESHSSVAQILRFEGDSSGRFVDDDNTVFEDDIEWIAGSSITKGCNPPASDFFCPDEYVTRGQMAAFLVRALGLTDRLDDPFTDDDYSIYEADIEKLAAAGITKGCNPPSNDMFCPDSKVTREQMAAFLVRALGYTDDGGGNLFTDDDESIFEADIDRLATAGVTKGCNPAEGNTKFCPTGYVTRGQMAAFLHRALG